MSLVALVDGLLKMGCWIANGGNGLPVEALLFMNTAMSSRTLSAEEGYCFHVSPTPRPIAVVVSHGVGVNRCLRGFLDGEVEGLKEQMQKLLVQDQVKEKEIEKLGEQIEKLQGYQDKVEYCVKLRQLFADWLDLKHVKVFMKKVGNETNAIFRSKSIKHQCHNASLLREISMARKDLYEDVNTNGA